MPVNGTDFDALFDTFAHSAFRFEARPSYAVGGDEAVRIAAFREGRPRPERSVQTSPWMARIAVSTVVHGKSWSRVRVVDEPLTEYQRYQLESYKESQAVGERIRISTRSAGTDAVGVDYWLFDGGTSAAFAVVMHYGDNGAVQRRELVPAGHPDVIGMHERAQELVDAAVDLNEFLARPVRRT